MKKIYYLTLAFMGIFTMAKAQTPCDLGRYYTDLFPTIAVTNGVVFGSNTDFLGTPTNLSMDIYAPVSDSEPERPLIIWAHGGSFIAGSRTDADVVALSTAFAKKGFVCVSIDYRTGMWPIDSVNAVKAVVRSVQDMRAAVRYFYKDKQTTNTYKIDTNNIIIGGSSAGAITALHMAYLDKSCKLEAYISSADLSAMGGLEGESGNPGYSSNTHAVLSLAGALASYGWLEAGDIPFCSLQGDQDNVVPYNRGVASVSGFNVIYMDGSRVLNEQANLLGVQNNFYTHYGAGHSPYATGTAYMDTTINFITDFLVDHLGCSEPILQADNTPTGTVNLYPLPYCGLGLEDNDLEISTSIYPNPSDDFITVEFDENQSIESVELFDLSGRRIKSYEINSSQLIIEKGDLKAGTYVLKIMGSNGRSASSKIMFN